MVQVGVDTYIELDSELVYSMHFSPCFSLKMRIDLFLTLANHFCYPNVPFDVSSEHPSEWKVVALKDIDKRSELTSFHPSTEWEAAEPFKCKCGAQVRDFHHASRR